MISDLAGPVSAAITRYRTSLELALPGGFDGIYLTGSVALGDWIPARSDLDLLTVTSGPLTPADLDALADLHARLAERPYLDACYVHRDDVGAKLAPEHPGWPHVIDGEFHRDGYQPDPVLWATLDRHGVTVQGPPPAALAVAPDPAWLRDWNLGNLASYWRPWAADARIRLADRAPDVPVSSAAVVWGLLGPGRAALHDLDRRRARQDRRCRLHRWTLSALRGPASAGQGVAPWR